MQVLGPYLSPWEILSRLPEEFPICFLGGSGRFALIATDFYRVSFDQWKAQGFPPAAGQREKFWGPGYLGLISYDEYDLAERPEGLTKSPSLAWRVKEGLVFDQVRRVIHWFGSEGLGGYQELPAESERWQLSLGEIKKLCKQAPKSQSSLTHFSLLPESLEGGPSTSLGMTGPGVLSSRPEPAAAQRKWAPWRDLPRGEAQYLRKCKEAIEQIRAGRYYQINLLRYFSVKETLMRPDILARLQKWGGPFSAYLDFPEVSVASFSPERFLKIRNTSGTWRASCEPIKGTTPSFSDRVQDELAKQRLLRSRKDKAELHMIVDLMRNDLFRVSEPGSVQVVSAGSLHSFRSVHHLIAEISSILRQDLRWKDVLQALCPAGSITGAPKKEVMQAIAEFEQTRRGYFMGHVFYMNESGAFDSSITIRTLVGRQGRFTYAAGSGIVIGSNAEKELREIQAKCRVLTEA